MRIWRAFGLQPHRVENFKFSKDPQFVEKVRDIVGLYLNPPDRAIVLCVDEKSQVQALNRTQPILPLAPGVPARQSHDYERHGVTSLFAAMDVASGVTISTCYRRHRHQEFLRFLNQIEDSLPRGFVVGRCSCGMAWPMGQFMATSSIGYYEGVMNARTLWNVNEAEVRRIGRRLSASMERGSGAGARCPPKDALCISHMYSEKST